MVQVSQLGYHPKQKKVAVIETDKRETDIEIASLVRIEPDGNETVVQSVLPKEWGRFVRYRYLQFDFSAVQDQGIYKIEYAGQSTLPFPISADIYQRHAWQPTLEYFLPVQMCHMRVNDRYRVWHGLCHMDDALMAPPNTHHFDGYKQGESTLTDYEGMEPVPGLNVGGWHDAGDYDLRVESQARTVEILAQAYETFDIDYDQTMVDQKKHLVELHLPDGHPDLLQQVEHGVLTILAPYRVFGRLYDGIICPNLRQYVLLGDGSTMTDNRVYDPSLKEGEIRGNRSGTPDDRWVFTEENLGHELLGVEALAAAARVLRGYDDELAKECLTTAEALWKPRADREGEMSAKIAALTQLYLTTQNQAYLDAITTKVDYVEKRIDRVGSNIARIIKYVDDDEFVNRIEAAVKNYAASLEDDLKENPYGVPYRPNIWGAGWNIQRLGVSLYQMHRAWPELMPADHFLHALEFVLGRHPGSNTRSFASGVGGHSLLVAYGTNRAEWSYIPGGVASGTAYIRPDLPELKIWPFFWQQGEYVMGGGASNYMFLAMAAEKYFE